jgi:2',3'-cyclic-nucleotide 2'-phosphodiesterase / 3'-nucleotidase / 5'-nucleotidase
MLGRILTCLGLAGTVVAAQAPRRLDLVVVSTTDVHNRLRGWDYYADRADPQRGLSRAATVVDSVRAAHPGRVVLVDAGDLLQGSPLGYVAARLDTAGVHPVIAAMNAMRYDAAAIGNHEFNYGIPTLRRALKDARFPFLGANVGHLGAKRARPLVAPSRIVTRAGVRVAIVGATTPGAMVWDRENLAGRLRMTEVVGAVRREVAAVRRRGADVVLVVMHSGLGGETSYDTTGGVPPENVAADVARGVAGIDLIVFGHSHREVADTTINGVMLQQPRNWAQSVGAATLTLERRQGRWRVSARRGQVIPVQGQPEHPAVVAAVDRAHQGTVAWVNQTLGTTASAWRADSARVRDTPLIDFILEVQRKATGADLAATAAFDLNASLDAGPITIAEVARLYPYDNTLRAIRITGRQLRQFLEYSARYYRTLGTAEAASSLVDPAVPGFNFDMVAGAEYVLDLTRPAGARLTRLQVKGRDVADTDTFTMALNNYRQTGGGGFAMLRDAPVVYDKQEEIRDLLIAEVQRRGTLRPGDYHQVNWRLAPDSVVGPAYRAMRALPFDRSTGAATRDTAPAAHLTSGRWLRVIGTSDIHGALEARDFNAEGIIRGGAASLATAIRQARSECRPPRCESLWVDGGDQWQGSAASSLTLGRPVTEFLNRHALAAASLGNHEFDWSVDSMRVRLRDNRFPVLAANMRWRDGRDVEWMPDDTLLTVGALRVGVIGVISTETSRSVRAAYVQPFTFVDPAPVVAESARALRARGADAVVVVGHIGAFCDRSLATCTGEIVDLATALPEPVDAIVAGHSHRGAATLVRGIPIVQAYQKGSAIGVIDIPLGAPGERPRVSVRNVRPDSVSADPVEAAWVDSVTGPVRAQLARVVATTSAIMRRGDQGTFGNLLADAFRVVGEGDIGLMNGSGVRTDLRAGPVSLEDVFEAQPFDNFLVRYRATGRQIVQNLEGIFASANPRIHLSGIRVSVDTTRATGSRVLAVHLLSGAPLDMDRTYRVVLNDFMAERAEGMDPAHPTSQVETLTLLSRDALATYLQRVPGPVRPPDDSRITHLRR